MDMMAKEMPHFLDKRVTKVGELLKKDSRTGTNG